MGAVVPPTFGFVGRKIEYVVNHSDSGALALMVEGSFADTVQLLRTKLPDVDERYSHPIVNQAQPSVPGRDGSSESLMLRSQWAIHASYSIDSLTCWLGCSESTSFQCGPRQSDMQRCEHLRAFADGGSDALHRSGTDIADRINPAPAGFQRMAARAKIRAGQHEPFGIQVYPRAGQPIRVRVRAR